MAEGSGLNVEDREESISEDCSMEDEEDVSTRLIEARVREGMYDAIRRGTRSNQEIVNEWIAWYNEEKDSALLELHQCFIDCAGCRSKITLWAMKTIPYQDLVKKLTTDNEFDDDNRMMTEFRTSFQEFVELMFRSGQCCVLRDLRLLQRLITFLKALCVSANGQFRFTGTFIGLKLTTALIETTILLENDDNIEEGQGEGAVWAGLTNRELRKLTNKFQEKVGELFNSFFHTSLRFRNVEIRGICINELGLWIVKYPETFFKADKLKYIGEHLSDENTTVKIDGINVLQSIFDAEELYSEDPRKLENFTTKFKNFIIAMAREMNDVGSVAAIRLLTSIFKNLGNVLTVDDCDQVNELICAPNCAIGEAAKTFLMTIWNAENQGGNVSLLRRLVTLLIESKLPEPVPYAVDSLISEYPLLKDWKLMTDLLLDGPAIDSEELPFDKDEVNMLIKLMAACVKQAATGEKPEGRESDEIDAMGIEKDRQLLTRLFIPLMEDLLNKYERDSEKVTNLLIIPRYFNFSIQMKRTLEMLWHKVSDIVADHTDEKVLAACAKIFKVFSDSLQIHEAVDDWIKKLVDEYFKCVKKYRRDIRAEANSAKVLDVVACLKKLACFYWGIYFDYGERKLFDSVFFFVVRGREWDEMPEDIVQFSITTCLHILMAEFHLLYNADEPPEEEIDSLKPKLKKFLDEFQYMISVARQSLQLKWFTMTCDLLFKFGKLFVNRYHLNGLVYTPTKEYKTELATFLEKYVFDAGSEVGVADRRRFLVSFCQLIHHKIVDVQFAAVLFKNYRSVYKDIIEETREKALEINLDGTVRTFLISLWELFTQIKNLTGEIDRNSSAFTDIKELAKQFASFLESANSKVYQAVYTIHRIGIGLSANPLQIPEDPNGPPPNIGFLEILREFSKKLSERNKNEALKFLESTFGNPAGRDDGEWEAYQIYRRSLIEWIL